MSSLSRIGLTSPRPLVSRIATVTTATWPRYGLKNARIRRIVRPRRSGGTGTKSPGPPRAPNARLAPRPAPPLDAMERPKPPPLPVTRLPGGQRVGFGDPLRLEPALRVDRGLAAVARRGDGLAIPVVVDVAGDEDALDPCVSFIVDDEVALGVDLEPVLERLGVGAVADRDEQAVDRQRLLDADVGVDLDLRIDPGPLDHDLAGLERVTPMEEVDLRGEAGQVGRLLER